MKKIQGEFEVEVPVIIKVKANITLTIDDDDHMGKSIKDWSEGLLKPEQIEIKNHRLKTVVNNSAIAAKALRYLQSGKPLKIMDCKDLNFT